MSASCNLFTTNGIIYCMLLMTIGSKLLIVKCVDMCRGRARAHGSHYVLMLEKDNRDHELLLSQVVG